MYRSCVRTNAPWVTATLACLAATSAASAAEPARLPAVEVLSVTPVPGTDVPRDHIPANVQTINAETMRRAQSINVPEAMLQFMPSVNVNEIQGNPYQLDVNYRGFTASPLLGTPQGLSVFQDGVTGERTFRRHRELGSHPHDRRRFDLARAGLQSALRFEHARRRARRAYEKRPHGAGDGGDVCRGFVRPSPARSRSRRALRRHALLRRDQRPGGRRLARLLAFARAKRFPESGTASQRIRVGACHHVRRQPSYRQRPPARSDARPAARADLHTPG